MKQKTATVLLIILNALAFSAGIWAAFGSMGGSERFWAAIMPSILFLAVLPSPLVFVWRYFRDMYNFRKTKFFICTLVPPHIITAVICAVLVVLMCTADSTGYGGLVALALLIALLVAQSCLMTSAVVWVSLEELFEKIKSGLIKKLLALALLAVCGAVIFSGLYVLLNGNLFMQLFGNVFLKTSVEASYIASYILNTLLQALIPALLIGFGVAALMRVYLEEYSVKAPLFMLCAFLPTLLIAGVRLALRYSADTKYYFYHSTELFDTLIFTAAIAVTTAAISALTAFIRSRRHYY